MVSYQNLKNLIDITGINFQFTISEKYKPIFEMLYDKVKDCDNDVINKKFQELWKTTSEEWNKKYGFRGYPSLAQWLEILVKKPLTDEEIAKRKIEYENGLRIQVGKFIVILNDPYFERVYYNRYLDPNYIEVKLLADKYCNVKGILPEEKIRKMAHYLKKELQENKEEFCQKLIGIVRKHQPLLLY